MLQLVPALAAPTRNICIVMLGAVGDVVFTLPVVAALKRDDPTRKITWILQPGPASLLQGHPDVDEILLFRRRDGLRGFLDIRQQLRRRHFDITLAMQSYFKAGLLTAFTRSPVKLGFDRKRARDGTWLFTNFTLPPRGERHFQDQYLEFVEYLGIDPQPLEWKLGPWGTEREWQSEFVQKFDRPIVSIVLGTSRPERDWFPDRWAAVVRSLHESYGLMPVLVGGRSDRELAAARIVEEQSGVPVVSTLGESFRRLVSILDSSALVISPNTGPMHMSEALNRPVISLHGFGNPKRVGPYARFLDLAIDRYGDAESTYEASPTNRRGRMEKITVADVLEKIELWNHTYRAAAESDRLTAPDDSGPKG